MKNSKLYKIIRKIYWVKLLSYFLKNATFPGFQGNSIYSVLRFFIHALSDDNLVLRASSMSYNFFLALFPAIIFFFTLIPYIPLKGLDKEILSTLHNFMPETAYITIKDTISEIISNQKGGLLSFGFLAAIYFTSNGFNTMISAFNKSSIHIKRENFLKKRGKSIFLTFFISFLLLSTVIVTFYAEFLQYYIYDKKIINAGILKILIVLTEKLIFSSLIFYSISFLYNIGSAKIYKWPIISPGAILATFLSLVSNYVFIYYVNNFNSYNKVYGSIGTIIVLMLIIYINCITLLIGYELNASIDKAKIKSN